MTSYHFRWQNHFCILCFADKSVTENAIFAWKKR